MYDLCILPDFYVRWPHEQGASNIFYVHNIPAMCSNIQRLREVQRRYRRLLKKARQWRK
jgi:hypothetical protein